MKNIVLIEPKTEDGNLFKSIHMPRLGLPMLGAQLSAAGFEVKIYISTASGLPWDNLLKADLAGISTTTATSQEAYLIAKQFRSHGIPVVIGGIHATFIPDEAIQYGDYVIRGEADKNFLELVLALAEGRKPRNIPGVSYWCNGKAVHTPYSPWEINVNELPIPDLSLFIQGNPLKSRYSTIPVATSRGCPYNCIFCSVTPMFGHRYRYRSTEKILQEISLYKGKKIFFCDDNFTANLKRTKKLLREMLRRKISVKSWGAQVRVEAARDEEFLDLMRRTGGDKAYVGLESINPATLEAFNKKQSVEDIINCVKKLHEYKIKIHGMFVLGSDSDNSQTIRDTVEFAEKLSIDSVQFMILTPLPGTPLFENLEAEGRLFTKDWKIYEGHHVVYHPAQMSPAELQKETYKAYQRFYRFRNIFKNFFLTGWESSLYRAIGWWLVRRYEKDNRLYCDFLEQYENSPKALTHTAS